MNTFKYVVSFTFLIFAGLQYNDPDPFIWIPIYILAAGITFEYKRFSSLAFFVLSAFLFLWATSIFPDQWEGVMLNQAGMKTLNIELGRESLGLILIAIVFLFLSFKRKN